MSDDDDDTDRACVSCPAIYTGGIKCPDCGEPGEPVACCGEPVMREDSRTGQLDCVSCGWGWEPPGVPMVALMDDSGEWLRGSARADASKGWTSSPS